VPWPDASLDGVQLATRLSPALIAGLAPPRVCPQRHGYQYLPLSHLPRNKSRIRRSCRRARRDDTDSDLLLDASSGVIVLGLEPDRDSRGMMSLSYLAM
jgi:hypothetical protein